MGKETGFPSPAQGYEAKNFDFNKFIVKNAPATYVMRCESADLLYRGIFPDCLLVVDRSRKPVSGSLVVFSHEGVFRCREFIIRDRKPHFVNGRGEDLALSEPVVVFGVVTRVIREV